MKYTIVTKKESTNYIKEFRGEVNRLIEKGWKPHGGINVLFIPGGWYFHQAMIKEEDDEKDETWYMSEGSTEK